MSNSQRNLAKAGLILIGISLCFQISDALSKGKINWLGIACNPALLWIVPAALIKDKKSNQDTTKT